MLYVVTYRYDSSQAELISQVRPTHREFLANLHANGPLRASGPWVGTSEPGAFLLLATESGDEALRLLDEDPFFSAGVIVERTVTGWDPVIGVLADSSAS